MLLKQNKICIFVSQEKNASSWKIRVIVLKRLNSQGHILNVSGKLHIEVILTLGYTLESRK